MDFSPWGDDRRWCYLLVYSSGLGVEQPAGVYHTNFRLEESGEFLALVRPDSTVEQEFAPTYPEQKLTRNTQLP